MITWKLEVEDGKCRPSGSPPRDTSLAAFADLRMASGALCEFPQHAEDCKCVVSGATHCELLSMPARSPPPFL